MTKYGEDEGTFGKISGFKYRKGVDERTLARLGKKQELQVIFDARAVHLSKQFLRFYQRRFGFLSVFGFSCCVLVTWELAIM